MDNFGTCVRCNEGFEISTESNSCDGCEFPLISGKGVICHSSIENCSEYSE